jgi:hypothetical protein
MHRRCRLVSMDAVRRISGPFRASGEEGGQLARPGRETRRFGDRRPRGGAAAPCAQPAPAAEAT